jgi:hypothetical protein
MYMATVTIVPEVVPNDCFLRKLPVGLSLVQRMQFDALRIAADMIGLANWRLVNTALHICREEQLRPTGASMSALLLDAWSIITHCHTIRGILGSLKFNTAEISSFLAETRTVSEIRDAQQHYQSQFPNRAQKKTKTAPLYGALRWTYARDSLPLTGLYLVTCWSGATIERKLEVAIPNPAGQDLRVPIGRLHLQAFDYDIDLQQITDWVSSLVHHFNTYVADLVRQGLDKLAEEKKVDKAKLQANAGADLFLALWAEIKR